VRVFCAGWLALVGAGLAGTFPVAADSVGLPVQSPVALPNSTSACPLPVSVTGVFDQTVASQPGGTKQQHWAKPGDAVEVDGQGFAQPGCAVSVSVGGLPAPAPASVTNTALTFAAPALSQSAPAGLDGPVTVQLQDAAGSIATSNGTYHFLEEPSATVQETSPVEGTTATLAGLGLNGSAEQGDATSLSGTFAGCPGAGSVVEPATASSATQAGLTVPGTYCDGPVALGVFLPHYDTAQGATDDTAISVTVPVGSVDVAPVVSSVTPRTVAAGDYLTVLGSGFGPTGSATIGRVSAAVAWSDHEIAVQAPTAATAGTLALRRGSGDRGLISAGSITVVQAPTGGGSGPPPVLPPGLTPVGTTGPGVTPGYPTGSGGTAVLPAAFDLPFGTVPRSHAAAPYVLSAAQSGQDNLRLSPAKSQATVGSTIDIVVTLTVAGKQIADAPISLSIVSAPGADAAVRPATGHTDSSGQFHAALRLSRLVGDTIVLARSGPYSDEVHVLGQAKTTGASIHLPFGTINISGNPMVVWLSVAAIVLVLAGVAVNINVMRRFVWSLTGGRVLAWWARRRPAKAP
jgi:hypothetical protein